MQWLWSTLSLNPKMNPATCRILPPLPPQHALTPRALSPPDRRPSCTHTRVARHWGSARCQHCGRAPRLGWVWRCAEPPGPPQPQPGPEADDAALLKPWMREAAARGEYTPDQVRTLARQRRGVLRAARKQEGAAGSGMRRAQLRDSRPCTYQTCAACRPGFVDRAWVPLEEAMLAEAAEIEAAPVSDGGVCRQLGLRHGARMQVSAAAAEEEGELLVDEFETRFESALGGLGSVRESRPRPGAAGGSAGLGLRRLCGSVGGHVRESLPPRPVLAAFDWCDENMRLNITPRDGSKDHKAQVGGGGEVRVGDGVAVTEEAVGTEMADIITG